MTEKKATTIPTKCSECYKTDFQIEGCPYSIIKDLEKSIKHFEKLGIALPLNRMAFEGMKKDLANKCEKCKTSLAIRAKKIREDQKFERLFNKIDDIFNQMADMQGQIDDVKNQNDNQIFKSQQDMDDIPEKEVRKPVPEANEIQEPPPPASTEHKIPKGGWKTYQRNVKKENVNKFLDKLIEKHPELKEEVEKLKAGKKTEAVDITNNSTGHKMIKYREMVKQ